MKHSTGAGSLWQRLNEINIPLTPQLCITSALIFLSALPMFVSATFPFLSTEARATMIDAAVMYIFGNYWRDCLYVSGICAALGALFFWIKQYRKDSLPLRTRSTFCNRALPLFLFLLLLWSFLSTLASSSLHISLWGTAYRQDGFLTYLIYACIFSSALLLDQKQSYIIAEVLCAACAATALLSIGLQQELDLPFYLSDAQSAMFHNSNHYGYYLAICLPLCMGLLIGKTPSHFLCRILRLAEFWLICNAAAINSVRGSFLGIAVAFILWNIIILRMHRDKLSHLLLADIVFLSTFFALNTGSDLFSRFGDAVTDLKNASSGDPASLDDIGSGRGEHWRLGIQFITERPLLGYGPDNLGFRFFEINPTLTDRPHNELIQIAASLGIPALFFYLCALWSHFLTFTRILPRLSVFELALFSGIVSYLVSSMFGNTMYYTTPYFYLLLSMTYRACKSK